MFEEPATKRVLRSDLRSPSRSLSPTNHDDHETQEALRAKLRSAIQLDFVDVKQQPKGIATQADTTTTAAEEEDENTFAFKLFASAPAFTPSIPRTSTSTSAQQPTQSYTPITAPSNTNTTSSATAQAQHTPTTQPHPQRIQLITLDDANTTETGLTSYPIPTRPLSYYIAPPASALKKERYRSAALETNDILNLAKIERKGLACPWRILHIPITLPPTIHNPNTDAPSLSSSDVATTTTITPTRDTTLTKDTTTEARTKRSRKSKKTRIKLRLKFQKRVENEKRRKEAEKAKEEHVRDKKTRMNRAKQLRKRERARLAKGDGGGGGSVVGGGGSDDGDDDDDANE